MLWNLRVGRARKMGLSLLLFPGVFVIAAALIRVIMSLQARPSALNINRWGVRETLAGIIAVNIPILRPILLRAFWTPGGMPSDQENSHKSPFGSSSNPRKWTLSSASAISRRGQQHLSSTHELQEDIEVQNKGNAAIEISDHLSECSNHSGADSDDFIIQRPLVRRERISLEKMVCLLRRALGALSNTGIRSSGRQHMEESHGRIRISPQASLIVVTGSDRQT